MPTPFNHLRIAHDMLAHPDLHAGWRALAQTHWPAFALGHIAPDVQTLSGQSREATHFFPVPLLPGLPRADRVLFALYPTLQPVPILPPAQAAFIAGYVAHLVFDWLWVKEIFDPHFGIAQTWENFPRRIFAHNVLRAYWDWDDWLKLSAADGQAVLSAHPSAWLPFVSDQHLSAWATFVGNQLVSGQSRTLEVFAGRMRLPERDLRQLLESPEAMQARVFCHVSLAGLHDYRAAALNESVRTLNQLWLNEVSS